MPIDFHAEENRFSYATRQAHPTWIEAIKAIVDVQGKKVADIGCGGGIYSAALAEMGAAHVAGIDFSEEMLKAARANCLGYPQISFVTGNALDTGLAGNQFDVILERAVIHHLARQDVEQCFKEAFRLLKPGGILIVQDRTPEDCLLPGSGTNIRGYFFARYPKLREREIVRRLDSEFVMQALLLAGFVEAEERKLWEVRAIYPDLDALSGDILARTGRSILHELTDTELQDLVIYIREQLQAQGIEKEIVDRDRWTVWNGVRK